MIGALGLGYLIIWFQVYAQFVWKTAANHPIWIAIVCGPIVAISTMKGAEYAQIYFDGFHWPGRFVAFSIGIVIFAVLTWYFLKEPINLKTVVTLLLAIGIIIIQAFWKTA